MKRSESYEQGREDLPPRSEPTTAMTGLTRPNGLVERDSLLRHVVDDFFSGGLEVNLAGFSGTGGGLAPDERLGSRTSGYASSGGWWRDGGGNGLSGSDNDRGRRCSRKGLIKENSSQYLTWKWQWKGGREGDATQ